MAVSCQCVQNIHVWPLCPFKTCSSFSVLALCLVCHLHINKPSQFICVTYFKTTAKFFVNATHQENKVREDKTFKMQIKKEQFMLLIYLQFTFDSAWERFLKVQQLERKAYPYVNYFMFRHGLYWNDMHSARLICNLYTRWGAAQHCGVGQKMISRQYFLKIIILLFMYLFFENNIF